jgi:HK97 family phage major capsid protein
MTLEEAQKAIKEGMAEVNKGLKDLEDANKKKADQETVTKLATDLADAIKKCDAAVAGAEAIQKELGGLKGQQKEVSKSLSDQVREGITEEICKSLKTEARKAKEIVVKAASNMSTGYALTGSFANLMRTNETEAGVSKAPDRKPWILDLISVGTTKSHTVFWVERTLREGGPAQTAEAGTFPIYSFTYEKKSASSKKTATYSKVTEEMIEDVDFIQSEVQTEIMEALPLTLDSQLLNGNGTGENHLGILSQATAFAKPTGFDTLAAPNNFDVIRAAILQIQVEQFYPSAIVLHPADAANMELLKDAEGRYLNIPFMGADGKIRGIQVVENTGVAAGSFLLGDFKKAKLFVNRDITIRFWDQVGNDPIEDLMTVTGSMRAIFRIKTPDRKAFVKGTFSAAKTAITTA